MQTQNPFLDDIAKLTTAAMGLAQAAGEEAKTAFRAQADRLAVELDLIRRDEFEALKAEIAGLRVEIAALKGEPVKAAPKAKPAAKAAAKTTSKPSKAGKAATPRPKGAK